MADPQKLITTPESVEQAMERLVRSHFGWDASLTADDCKTIAAVAGLMAALNADNPTDRSRLSARWKGFATKLIRDLSKLVEDAKRLEKRAAEHPQYNRWRNTL